LTSTAATIGGLDGYQKAVSLFTATLRPYLDSLEAWTQRGVVLDPQGEFMIGEDSSVAPGTVHQWRFGFTLRRKPESEKDVGGGDTFDLEANAVHEEGDDDLMACEVDGGVLPSFLVPLARELLTTGKAAHLITMMHRVPADECVVAASRVLEEAVATKEVALEKEASSRARAEVLLEMAEEAKVKAKGMSVEAAEILERSRRLHKEAKALASGAKLEDIEGLTNVGLNLES